MKKGITQKGVWILAAAMMMGTLSLGNVHAAIGVESSRTDCAIEIAVPAEGFAELAELEMDVKLYKVATIDISGNYTVTGVFDQDAMKGLADLSPETTAADWEALAKNAKTIIDTDKIEATATGKIAEGSVLIEDLATGLYLVDVGQVMSDAYIYDFTPYLVSLPNNYYYTPAEGETADDTWVYELTGDYAIGLKPEREDRFGKLVINKLLDTYNATNGGATFVFQIEAVKADEHAEEGAEAKVVYSNVVSMTFDQPGTESLTVEKIPAGAVVTVTEIYSGANYVLTSSASETTTIVAESEGNTPAEVSFSNTHDDRVNGGSGVVNTFTYENDQWTHTQAEDSVQ